MFYDTYSMIVLIPAIIFSMIASAGVKSTFAKYTKVRNSRNITGAEAARIMLQAKGINNVRIEPIAGNLTDNFDSRINTLHLSESVYNQSTIGAVAVACHEAGHAMQHAYGYRPINIRNLLVLPVNLASRFSWIFIMIGLFLVFQGKGNMSFLGDRIFNIGVLAFVIVLIFHLITLPVEFNASSRAIQSIKELGLVSEEELGGAKSVLRAAAMTYVAATAVAAANLIRILMIRGRRD